VLAFVHSAFCLRFGPRLAGQGVRESRLSRGRPHITIEATSQISSSVASEQSGEDGANARAKDGTNYPYYYAPPDKVTVFLGLAAVCLASLQFHGRRKEHARSARIEETGFAAVGGEDSTDISVGIFQGVRGIPDFLVARKRVFFEDDLFDFFAPGKLAPLAAAYSPRPLAAIVRAFPLLEEMASQAAFLRRQGFVVGHVKIVSRRTFKTTSIAGTPR